MESQLPITLCDVRTPDGLVTYATLIPPEEMATRGLAAQAILGQVLDRGRGDDLLAPDNFARNRAFVDFMQEVIRRHGPSVPDLVAAARAQRSGWVYIVDGRTPTPQGPVPPEDIIGGFQVEAGDVVADSYQANPNHRILSQRGFLQLDPFLRQRLLDALAALG